VVWSLTTSAVNTNNSDMMRIGGVRSNSQSMMHNTQHMDAHFIEQMIPHHQMAVMMAQMLYNSTDREEMKNLAQNIIKAQTNEINDMRSWYAEWYQ
jgi:uncharacterized protein (DUF305 family)